MSMCKIRITFQRSKCSIYAFYFWYMWSLVYIGVHTIISKLTLWKKICEEQENCFNVTWGLFSFLAFMNDVCLPPFVLCCVCHFTSFSSGFIFDWQFTEYLYIENLWDYSSVNVLFLQPKSGEKKPNYSRPQKYLKYTCNEIL